MAVVNSVIVVELCTAAILGLEIGFSLTSVFFEANLCMAKTFLDGSLASLSNWMLPIVVVDSGETNSSRVQTISCSDD